MQQYNGNNRTKRQLASALKELLKKKPLSKITIRELTDACMIKRQSFYYHFSDIYELLQWTLERDAFDFEVLHKGGNLEEIIASFVSYADQNRAAFFHMLAPEVDHRAARFLNQFLYEVSDWTFQCQIAAGLPVEQDPQYLGFLKECCRAIFQELLFSRAGGRLEISKETLVQYFVKVIRDQLVGAAFAENPEAPHSPKLPRECLVE